LKLVPAAAVFVDSAAAVGFVGIAVENG